MFGNPETTTGGRALKFYASLRLDIRRIATIKAPDGTAQGSRVKVKVVKNKVAPPFMECEFDIMYAEGISKAGSLLDVAVDMGILEKRGSWFSFGDVQVGQGREQTKKVIAEDLELQKKIEAKVREKMQARMNANGPMPQEEEEEFDDFDEAVETTAAGESLAGK